MPRVKGKPRGFTASHAVGAGGRAACGTSYGTGFTVTWPSSAREGDKAGVTDAEQLNQVAVLCDVAADRLAFLLSVGVGGSQTAAAITQLKEAVRSLRRR